MRRLALAALSAFIGLSGLALAQVNNPTTGSNNFRPNIGGTLNIAATTTTASVTLTATDAQNPELRIVNTGTTVVFCRWGIGAQTALTAVDVPIAGGATQDFTKGTLVAGQGQTFVVACIMGTGTGTIYVVTGQGRQ